jgi:hypothetical protein
MPGPNKGQKMTKIKRPIRICGDVAYVPLTQGYEAIIDAADVPLVEGHNWYAGLRKTSIYAVANKKIGIKFTVVYLHRILMFGLGSFEVDHKDGDGLNNMRCNLREATKSQNMHNMRIKKTNTSGFKGVDFYRRNEKWRSRINFDGNRINLGYFASPEEAHAAYCVASRKLHGEFGRTE